MNIEFLDELYRIKYSYIEKLKKAEIDINLKVTNNLEGNLLHENRKFQLEYFAVRIQEHNELIKKYVESR